MSRYPGRILSSTAPTVSALSAKGIWTLDEALRYQRAGTWPVPTGGGDPYFGYNTLLLPGQGTNGAQNNTFLDSSTNNFTITRNGNTTQGTFTPFSEASGYWSNYFNGSSWFTNATTISLGTNNFCMEAWYYSTTTTNYGIISQRTSFQGNGWVLTTAGFAAIIGGAWTDPVVGSSTGIANQWTHIAITRSGSAFRLFMNGTLVGYASASGSIGDQNIPTIGAASAGGEGPFVGYISNVRICNGSIPTSYQTSVTTPGVSVFTPPTGSLTTTSQGAANVVWLTCQDNRFLDNSSVARVPTISGTPSVQTFQPFGTPTSAYSAATIGGSGYFDGTGDWLTSATSGGNCVLSGDFTVESWVYPTSWGAYQRVISGGASTFYWTLGFSTTWDGNLKINWFDGNDYFSTAYSGSPLNTWYHLAVVRTGSTIYFYINGVRYGTSTYSATPGNANGGYMIGNRISSTEPWFGYMTDSRVVLGTNVYGTGSTITIPTAPLTAITNTSLLLNYTNAGVIDNAVSNDLETVGGAQISTTQYKWGASSIAFDGNGDYLVQKDTPNLTLGTGDFTIEFWVYYNSGLTADVALFDCRPASTNGVYPLIFSNTTGKIVWYINSAARITGTTTLVTGTWYHVAVSRSASSTKLFINGNQDGSTYADTNNYLLGTNRPLIGAAGATVGADPLNGYLTDLRVTKGLGRYLYNFTAPTAAFPLFYQAAATPSSDPYFKNTTLLLPGNGTNGAQNNTFLDSSTNNFTITRNGNTTQGTFTPFSKVDGRWGNYFSGGTHIYAANNTAFNLASSAFTIEAWIYCTGLSGTYGSWIAGKRLLAGPYNTSWLFFLDSSGKAAFGNGSTAATSSQAIPLNEWVHIAAVCNGTSTQMYVNGIASGASVTQTITEYNADLTIGNYAIDNPVFNGYISNLRLIKGQALTTGSFTAPTGPVSSAAVGWTGANVAASITGTVSLVTCQSNRFVDNSGNNFTITPSGTPSVQAFSPFPTTASYDASVNGGSGYFDGTGDFLSVTNNAAFNFGSAAFTIEFWYYPTTLSGTQCLITNYGGSTTGFVIQMGGSTAGSGKIDAGFSGDGADITSTNALKVNSWNHIAISGTPGATGIKLFINGAQEGSTYTGATSLDTSSTLLIGEVASTNRLSGYLCGLRLLKGTAQYTTTFTPPTTPPTAITNTSLLLNYTNGGIIDNAMSNDLETVGGAAISTTQSKFGGSSMYFDGNDKVTLPYSQNFNLGTNYTIEGWVYPTSVTGYQRIFDIVNSATSSPAFLDIAFNGTALVSELRTTNGGAVTTISGGTVSTGAWIHVALSVYSGSARLFLNGVQVGSTTTFSALPDQNFVGIGGIGNSLTIDYLTGYIDDLRITKGIARYVQNFTPPTTAFLTL